MGNVENWCSGFYKIAFARIYCMYWPEISWLFLVVLIQSEVRSHLQLLSGRCRWEGIAHFAILKIIQLTRYLIR